LAHSLDIDILTARIYAGIGARKSPPEILRLMTDVAAAIARKGWALRTGGAEGADEAFREGAVVAGGIVELYLPWPGFNYHASATREYPSKMALEIAEAHHPRFRELPAKHQALQGRNSHIILGADCATPATFALLWTAGGATVGGTGQGIRLCAVYEIPTFNLARADHRARVERTLAS
jgi:hypothetical protein